MSLSNDPEIFNHFPVVAETTTSKSLSFTKALKSIDCTKSIFDYSELKFLVCRLSETYLL